MDVREKYVMQKVNRKEKSICPNCIHHNLCIAENNQPCFECNRFIDAHGATVQEHDGCEYCKQSESVYHNSSGIHDSMDEDVYISGNNIVVDIGCHSYGTAEIKFCPMCGRELPQPPKGE